jgi:transcriptional regulator with XRE-family HTH domain
VSSAWRATSRLRERRLEQGLTLLDVSKAVGCSVMHLSNIERQHRNASGDTAARIVGVLRVRGDTMFVKVTTAQGRRTDLQPKENHG